MNLIGLLFSLIASTFILILPKNLVAIPFLMGALYMTRDPVLELGPIHLTLMQILVLVGILRAISKGERIAGGINRPDIYLILWAILLLGSSIFHTPDACVFRIGMIWIHLGSYFFFRIFIHDTDDIQRVFKALCVVLVPIATLLLLEKAFGKNYFSILGGVNEFPAFRHGHFRASGPFAHAILAGTVGAACFPMALYLCANHHKYALTGMLAAGGVIFASTSSGPIMMLLFILCGLSLWKIRDHLPTIRWLTVIAVFVLNAAMKDPVYFLMARIDISGGSTGWHRSELIRSSINHLDEWWLGGTDHTRHWMPTGTYLPDGHTDITNNLLLMGVMGGLPLMFSFIMVLVAAFMTVGRTLRESESASMGQRFLIWLLGSILFGYVMNFFSISLFDQSVVFFYLILACICASQSTKLFANVEAKQSAYRFTQSRYVAVKTINEKDVIMK